MHLCTGYVKNDSCEEWLKKKCIIHKIIIHHWIQNCNWRAISASGVTEKYSKIKQSCPQYLYQDPLVYFWTHISCCATSVYLLITPRLSNDLIRFQNNLSFSLFKYKLKRYTDVFVTSITYHTCVYIFKQVSLIDKWQERFTIFRDIRSISRNFNLTSSLLIFRMTKESHIYIFFSY